MAKGLRDWVGVKPLVRVGARECFLFVCLFFSCLTKCVKGEAVNKKRSSWPSHIQVWAYHWTSLVPRPFLMGGVRTERGRKGLVNNSTPTRIHGCIPAVSVDEGKRECQVGASRG